MKNFSIYKVANTYMLLFFLLIPSFGFAQECVVLLHGLARSSLSMKVLEYRLNKENYTIVNIDYPSKQSRVEDLSPIAIENGLKACEKNNASKINFVTHSMGGILVRQYYSTHSTEKLNRVVMLGPPNQGSEVVDELKAMPGFELFNGPAGLQLGTSVNDLPASLGKVNFELGVIAGTQSLNFLLSSYLPEEDDGKVSVESTKVQGMCGFISLPVTHTFMMNNEKVAKEIVNFLKFGKFSEVNSVSNFCYKEEKS